MDNFEKVEKLREKTGVSYTDAKEALEACNYDMLDAIVYLEKEGKANTIPDAEYRIISENNANSKRFDEAQDRYEKECKRGKENAREGARMVGKGFKLILHGILKLFEIDFVVRRHHNKIVSMPLILFLIFLIGFFWVTVPLLVVGLFFDCRYSFIGFDADTDKNINDLCDKVADSADDLKDKFKNA